MSYTTDRSKAGGPVPHRIYEDWPGSSFHDANAVRAIQQKVDLLAAHMHKQMKEHDAAMFNTHRVFELLLQDMDRFALCFQQAFAERLADVALPYPPQIAAQTDPDRSVGILRVLWHTISFSTRGNTKPLALNRPGRPPLFTGRIIALAGDLMDTYGNLQSPYFTDLLHHEVASLFVPADPNAPAVMQIRHRAGEELYFHQVDAPRLFLLKVVEIACGGGYFHEQAGAGGF